MAKRPKTPKKSARIRYKLFAHAYAVDQNATKAALIAGYSPRTADKQGSRLLNHVEVKAAIASIVEQRAKKMDISAERVLKEIAVLGFSNMMDYMSVAEDGEPYVDLSKLTREQAAAIQEFSTDTTGGTGDGERLLIYRRRFKLADKTKNLELLGKHLKLFTDVHEVTGIEGLAELLRARRKAVSA